MSLSKPLQRLAFIALSLGATGALGACTFSPVYSGRLAEQSTLTLAYSKPANRLEQLIYQELSLRLGNSALPTAPLVTVTASSSAVDLALSQTINPNKPLEVTVTATAKVERRDGVTEDPLTFTRSATASYTRNGQVLADREAAAEASERAAVAAGESLRLALLASLSR